MLHALNNVANATINETEATLLTDTYFLNYAASNPNAKKFTDAWSNICGIIKVWKSKKIYLCENNRSNFIILICQEIKNSSKM